MHLGRRLPAGQWQVEIALQYRVIPLFRGVRPSCSPRLGVCEKEADRLGCFYRSLTARTGWESELRSKAVTAPLENDREFCKRWNRRCASRSKLVALRNENGLHCAVVSERGRRPGGTGVEAVESTDSGRSGGPTASFIRVFPCGNHRLQRRCWVRPPNWIQARRGETE